MTKKEQGENPQESRNPPEGENDFIYKFMGIFRAAVCYEGIQQAIIKHWEEMYDETVPLDKINDWFTKFYKGVSQ